MNRIPSETVEAADSMFVKGASIRQVMAELGIARETAHRIQKMGRLADLAIKGKTRVACGRKADGSLAYYETSELRETWERQQYADRDTF